MELFKRQFLFMQSFSRTLLFIDRSYWKMKEELSNLGEKELSVIFARKACTAWKQQQSYRHTVNIHGEKLRARSYLVRTRTLNAILLFPVWHLKSLKNLISCGDTFAELPDIGSGTRSKKRKGAASTSNHFITEIYDAVYFFLFYSNVHYSFVVLFI